MLSELGKQVMISGGECPSDEDELEAEVPVWDTWEKSWMSIALILVGCL